MLSPTAVADIHEDIAPLIRSMARQISRRYHWREDECEADGYIDFLEAVSTYKPELGSLKARVAYVIASGARIRARAAWQQSRILRPSGVDPDTLSRDTHRPTEYEFGRLIDRVGPDARTVLVLLFDGPAELDATIRADPNPGPASIRRHLRLWLRTHCGWTYSRTLTAYKEIKSAI